MGGIASWVGKKMINTGLDKIRTVANSNLNKPLEGNLEDPLSGKPENGLVSKIVHVVHKGSVISAEWGGQGNNRTESDLRKLIKAQQQKNLPEVPLEENAEQGAGPQEGNEEPKVKMRPISLEDFKAMIGTKKGGLGKTNKGYVRFVKAEGGGIKLEKVGNKCGFFINSRINVTPEHNREMRQLFADTLLAEWGGSDRLAVDKDLYGSKIADKLGNLMQRILNGPTSDANGRGSLLSRAEIAACIREYESIFTDKETQKNISETFLGACFRGVEFVMPNSNNPKLQDFLARYGEKADEGFRTQKDLEDRLKACKNGAELRDAMMEIAQQFDKMNKHWQIDRKTMIALDHLNQSLTTGKSILSNAEKGIVGNVLLERLHENDKFLRLDANAVTKFIDKILPKLAEAARHQYAIDRSAIDREAKTNPAAAADKLARLEANFKERLSLDSIVKEAEKFFADFNKHKENNTAETAFDNVRTLLSAAKENTRAEFESLVQNNPNMSEEDFTEKRTAAEQKIAELDAQLAYLEDPQKVIDAKLKEIEQTSDDQFVLRQDKGENTQAKREWSKDELMDVIRGGAKDLPADFADELFMLRYTSANFKVKSDAKEVGFGYWSEDCKTALQNVLSGMTDKLDKAIKINLVSKDDISLDQFCSHMADVMLDSNIRNQMSTKTFTLDAGGNRKGSVTITAERLMKVFVDKAVAKKVGTDTRYADTLQGLKDKLNVLLKEMPKYITNLKVDDLPEVKRFYCDVRGFSRISVIEETKLYGEKRMAEEDIKRAVQIGMLEKFLDEDLMDLLDSTDNETFADEVDTRLNMRLQETVADTSEKAIERFYEGALNFRTGEVTDTSRRQETLDKKDIKDSDTQFTNARRVQDAYLNKTDAYDFKAQIAERNGKTAYHPIPIDQLKGKMVNRAKVLWHDEVVHNAPGRGPSDAVDWVVYKFKKTFGMNRFKDITDKWIQKRESGFEKKLDKMTSQYFAFEEKFVSLCRARAEKALLAKNDPRLASMHDPEMRALLLNDVLGGFQKEMAAVLERYIKTPAAFTKLLKNPASFERFVDDALGLTTRGDARIEQTKGFATLSKALDTSLDARMKLLDDWTAKDARKLGSKLFTALCDLANSHDRMEKLPQAQRDFLTDLLKPDNMTAYGNQLMTWATERFSVDVLAHPLDFYRPDQDAFINDLAGGLLADMTARFADFGKYNAMGTLTEKLGNMSDTIGSKQATGLAGDYEKAFSSSQDNNLLQLLKTEEKKTVSIFIELYAGIDKGKLRDSKSRADALVDAANAAVEHFENILKLAKTAQEGKIDKTFEALLGGYNLVLDDCEKTLRQKGVLPFTMSRFRLETDKMFKAAYEKLAEDIKTQHLSEVELKNSIGHIADGIRTQVDGFARKLADYLAEQHALGSEEGVMDLLAAAGLKSGGPGYADTVAFNESFVQLMKSISEEGNAIEDQLLGDLDVGQSNLLVLASEPNSTFKWMDQKTPGRIIERFKKLYNANATARAKDAIRARAMDELASAAESAHLSMDELTKVADEVKSAVEGLLKEADEANKADEEDEGASPEQLKDLPLTGVSEIISRGVDAVKLEHARQAWLDAHMEAVYNTVVAENFGDAELFGEASATMEANARISLHSQFEMALRQGLLATGNAEDWEKALETKPLTGALGGAVNLFVETMKSSIENAKKVDVEKRQVEQQKGLEAKMINDTKEKIDSKRAELEGQFNAIMINNANIDTTTKLLRKSVTVNHNETFQQKAQLKGWNVSSGDSIMTLYLNLMGQDPKMKKDEKTMKPVNERVQGSILKFREQMAKMVDVVIANWKDAVDKDAHHAVPESYNAESARQALLTDVLKQNKELKTVMSDLRVMCAYLRDYKG